MLYSERIKTIANQIRASLMQASYIRDLEENDVDDLTDFFNEVRIDGAKQEFDACMKLENALIEAEKAVRTLEWFARAYEDARF